MKTERLIEFFLNQLERKTSLIDKYLETNVELNEKLDSIRNRKNELQKESEKQLSLLNKIIESLEVIINKDELPDRQSLINLCSNIKKNII